MNKFAITSWMKDFAGSFARDEEGAQIIEYALIVAVVSLGLIVAMTATDALGFSTWIGKVKTCLTGGVCAK